MRVEDRQGKVLVSAAAARQAARLRLIFGDGKVDALVRDGLERGRRDTYSRPQGDQPKLI